MRTRIFGPAILCLGCVKFSFLPRRSPLGIFEGLESQPTAEWPALFLCGVCGHKSECFVPFDDCATPDSPLPDLWRIESMCDHKNCRRNRAIYTTYAQDSPEQDVRRLIIRLGVQLLCVAGHAYPLQDETIVRLARYPINAAASA